MSHRLLSFFLTLAMMPAAAARGIDPADILGQASGQLPFAQQSGYYGQVLGTHPAAASIPEEGIQGPALPNGETLRLGKEADPADPSRKALAFQLGPDDRLTSGSRRAEISFKPSIEMDRVYWVAFRMYVYDWGNDASQGLLGTQIHSGDNARGLSPSFGVYFTGREMRIEARYSTSPVPDQRSSVTARYANQPVPFGRWVDMVFRFRHNVSGRGFLEAWMDGRRIVNHQGNLGFNTPGYKDYAKFGVYNWSRFATPRKVLLHSPVLILDPSGQSYDDRLVRALIHEPEQVAAGRQH